MTKERRFYKLDKHLAGGAQIKVYPILGRAVINLTNLEEAARDEEFTKNLLRKHIEVVTPGAYYETEDNFFDNLLFSDSDLVMATLNALTYGPENSTTLKCDCKPNMEWNTNIVYHHIPIIEWDPDVLCSMKSEDSCLTTDVLGLEIKYTLKAINDLEDKKSILSEEFDKRVSALSQTVRYIETVGEDRVDIREWVADCSMPELVALTQVIAGQYSKSGFPDSVERRCPSCDKPQEVGLPFGLSSTEELTHNTTRNPKYMALLRAHAGSCIFQALKSINQQLLDSTVL